MNLTDQHARQRTPRETPQSNGSGPFGPRLLWASLPAALRKLHPRHQLGNPVMFVVWAGSALVTVFTVTDPSVFTVLVTAWLWFTVLFANLAEAVAEGRGRAQAQSLRRAKRETTARLLSADGAEQRVPGARLEVGDLVVVEAGEVIPGDGDVVEGIATVDESAITGESAPVIRESGGDRCAVTGGTNVLSDRIVVRITSGPGRSFVDRMITLVEGASRQKTPNEIALTILLSTLTIIFLLAVVALQPMAAYSGERLPVIVLTALLVCLIPTTIGALLSAIGIAGMDRLVQRNVLATSGRAVEVAATSPRFCSTRPAPSPSATAGPPNSCRQARTPSPNWPRPPGCPVSPTTRRRAAASSNSRGRSTACRHRRGSGSTAPRSSPSAPRPE